MGWPLLTALVCLLLPSLPRVPPVPHPESRHRMLTSYIVDGFADVGTMYGAKLLGAQQYRDFYTLRDRLVLMGGATGVGCGAGLWAFRVQVIGLFLGHRVAPESRAALEHLWPLLSGMQITNSPCLCTTGCYWLRHSLSLCAMSLSSARSVYSSPHWLLDTPGQCLPCPQTRLVGWGRVMGAEGR